MKKYTLLVMSLVLVYTSLIYSGTESIATVTSTDKGVNVTLPAPWSTQVFSGTFNATIDGSPTKLYCIDLYHNLAYNQPYQDVEVTNDTLSYVLNNYYPFKTGYAGQLTDVRREASAVQLALWHFTDNLNISAVTGSSITDIKNRALAIVTDALLNAHSFNLNNFEIYLPTQSFNIGSPITFTVKAFNDQGLAMPNVNIVLTTTGGTLSATNVTTDITGVTPSITLTPSSGQTTATITATGVVGIPSGTKYYHVADPNGKQKLILATPTTASRTISKKIDWFEEIKLVVEKEADKTVVNNGDIINYTLKVKNIGTGNASSVKVSDHLQPILDFISSNPAGVYDANTGIWNVGSLNAGDSSVLVITVKVDYNNVGATTFDLGAAKDFNLFVIDTLIQPSSDTEGKVAVGSYADLRNYSVGDKLPPNSGDVLVVGHHLTFISGRVYYGRAVYKEYITSTTAFTADGGIVKDSVIDFEAEKIHLEDLSYQLSTLAQTDTVKFQWGHIQLIGNHPNLNVFNLDASMIKLANNFTVDAPSNATVVVNVYGDTVEWKGGFGVTGTTKDKVILNFVDTKVLKVTGINITAAVLAPKTILDFPTGLITGQVIVKCLYGAGQMNLSPFTGNITRDTTIANFATVLEATNNSMPNFMVVPNASSIVTSNPTPSNIKGSSDMPESFNLMQNYPNPFNPSTTITFSIAKNEVVNVTIFNIMGEEITTIVNREFEAGTHSIQFNAGNLASGVYLYRMTSPSFSSTKKMILQK